ncbi:hypothetical protein JHK87_039648 [Glycine soja]|nr:hypothetical protein JHK87_039648 [Glycine soja]
MKGGGVSTGEDHDMADRMQCSDHPYRNNPSGIYAFCLQEKLDKLISSSFPLSICAPSSPSFRSDAITSSSPTLPPQHPSLLFFFLLPHQEQRHHPNTASASSFECKVLRSRFVGCGSRSFSRDFFKRISTRFGDCTLRSVESQHEGKPKRTGGGSSAVSNDGEHHHHHCMKERVTYGRLFSGFMIFFLVLGFFFVLVFFLIFGYNILLYA